MNMTGLPLKKSYAELSAFTYAKNCFDFSDIEIGLKELHQFIRINYPINCRLAHKRISALEKKKAKLIIRELR